MAKNKYIIMKKKDYKQNQQNKRFVDYLNSKSDTESD